jgi:hypothetical protein
MSLRDHRPSPALTIAILALVVATAGTAYAAARIARGSVHTAQLKANAVTSPKVKNRSLQATDLGAAARAGMTGPRGGAGTPGARGPRGQDGAAGAPGARGPSRVFASSSAMAVTVGAAPTVVGTLSLPAAGRYEISAKVVAEWTPATGGIALAPVTCTMASSAGGTGDSTTQTLLSAPGSTAKATLPLVSWQDLSAPATVTVSCSDVLPSGETAHAVASNVKIAALTTTTLTNGSP